MDKERIRNIKKSICKAHSREKNDEGLHRDAYGHL